MTPAESQNLIEKLQPSIDYFRLHGGTQRVYELEFVQEALASNGNVSIGNKLTDFRTIYQAVEAVTKIDRESLKARSRKRFLVDARKIFVLLALEFVQKVSLVMIGNEFKGQNHATIINARDTAMGLLNSDQAFRELYTTARNILMGIASKQVERELIKEYLTSEAV